MSSTLVSYFKCLSDKAKVIAIDVSKMSQDAYERAIDTAKKGQQYQQDKNYSEDGRKNIWGRQGSNRMTKNIRPLTVLRKDKAEAKNANKYPIETYAVDSLNEMFRG